MAETTTKTRKPNFTESETLMILQQVKIHKHVLISKLTDAMTNERKKDIWGRISEYINERSRNVVRTPGDIRRRWKNMVGAARKEAARIRTEESDPDATPSDLSMQILELNPEWQDFSSYSANEPDPALSPFMKVEIGDDDDDDDDDNGSHSSSPTAQSVRQSPRLSDAKRRRLEEAAQLHMDITHLDRENIILEKQKIKIEKEKLSMEKEQLAIERQRLGMEREKLALEKEKINMEKEKMTLEITYWKRKLLDLTRNSFDSATHGTD